MKVISSDKTRLVISLDVSEFFEHQTLFEKLEYRTVARFFNDNLVIEITGTSDQMLLLKAKLVLEEL